jgi:hypothetical protein
MGFFGFGKKSVSHKEIGDLVASHFQKLGGPKNIGQKEHEEKYIKMLNELDQWAESNDLGNFKRSSISGTIEETLRRTYKNTGVDDIVSKYLELSNTIIMKM